MMLDSFSAAAFQILLVAFIRLVCSTNPVPVVKERAVITLIMRMMVVMDLSTRTEGKIPKWHEPQVITTMSVLRLCESDSKPQIVRPNVALHKQRAHEGRK